MPARLKLLALSRRRSAKFALALLIAVVVITLVSFTARAWRSKPGLANAPSNLNAKTAFPGGAQPPRVKAVRFVISRHGIEPAELTIPSGQYLVAVDNDLDLDEIDISIDRVNGPRIKDGKTRKGQLKFRDFIDFTPGQYVLSKKKDSRITSKITVTNAR